MRKVNAAEGVRDVFGRILTFAANSKAQFDLRHLLRYLITTVPLFFAHSDGTPLQIDKAVLTKTLETKQNVIKTILPSIIATVIDGGIILHENILRHSKLTAMQQWHMIC